MLRGTAEHRQQKPDGGRPRGAAGVEVGLERATAVDEVTDINTCAVLPQMFWPPTGTSSSAAGQAAGGSWWQQLPSKQWVAQQASAAGAAAARGWQAVSSRSGQLQATFNPLQSLGGSPGGLEVGSPQLLPDAAVTSSASSSSSSQQQLQLQQQEPSQLQQLDLQQPRSRSIRQLLGQLRAGGGGVVEVTRGQLAALGAAASAAGAALGAVLVLVLSRSAGGAGAGAGGAG